MSTRLTSLSSRPCSKRLLRFWAGWKRHSRITSGRTRAHGSASGKRVRKEPGMAGTGITVENGSFEVDARLLAEALDLEPSEFMALVHSGHITSVCERG